jgi:hypothetical protein
MGWGRVAVVGVGLAVGVVMGAGTAVAAEPGNSAAAQLCGDGPQKDYYVVLGQEAGTPAPIDFGDLQHGVDEFADGSLAYVVTDGHGQCTSFFAENKKKGKGSGPAVNEIQITKVVDVASP